ncbi:hypothetical protein DFS34DRAFT_634337 [Phlyctochytrium arcticum]|nr:hypothetical protein DFS34DRAFT_634337 [Phlyctochytrium arcticum]
MGMDGTLALYVLWVVWMADGTQDGMRSHLNDTSLPGDWSEYLGQGPLPKGCRIYVARRRLHHLIQRIYPTTRPAALPRICTTTVHQIRMRVLISGHVLVMADEED